MMINQMHKDDMGSGPKGSAFNNFHPLANDYVNAVFPFWVSDHVEDALMSGDLEDVTRLFDDDAEIADNALLHLRSSKVIVSHGKDVAEALRGCTGLYVIVDDIDAIANAVSGDILSYRRTNDDIQELVVRHQACLTIYAQKLSENEGRLAA